jgi:hypothetical protein
VNIRMNLRQTSQQARHKGYSKIVRCEQA